jgi:hypothetical protein
MYNEQVCADFGPVLLQILSSLLGVSAVSACLIVPSGIAIAVLIERSRAGKARGAEAEEHRQKEVLTGILSALLAAAILPWFAGLIFLLGVLACIIVLVPALFTTGLSRHFSSVASVVPPKVVRVIDQTAGHIRRRLASAINWLNQDQVREISALKELLGLPESERERRIQLIRQLEEGVKTLQSTIGDLREVHARRNLLRNNVDALKLNPDLDSAARATLDQALQGRDEAVKALLQQVKERSQGIFEKYRELHAHLCAVRPCEVSIIAVLAEAETANQDALSLFEQLRS